MADVAREHLDELIADSLRTSKLLGYLIDVARASTEKSTWTEDVVHALSHARSIVNRNTQNLEHVRAIYDTKVHGGPDGGV